MFLRASFQKTCLCIISIGLSSACQIPFSDEQKISRNIPKNIRSSLPENPELSDYLHLAMINNSGMKAAFSRWKAAIEKIIQVKSLPDPRLTYGYFIEQIQTRTGPQQHRFGISQSLPWFGKLKLAGNRNEAQAKVAQKAFELVKSKVIYEVKEAYFEWSYLEGAVGLVSENLDLMKHLEKLAQSRFRVGNDGTGVVAAQVELGKLEDRLKSLIAMRVPLKVKFNAILNRDSDAYLPLPRSIQSSEISLKSEVLFERMLEVNPELAGLEANVEEKDHAIKLAKKAIYPDLSIGVDYIQIGDSEMSKGEDAIMIMGSFRIPFWLDKYQAKVREAKQNKRAAISTKADQKRRLQAELAMVLFHFQEAERKMNWFGNTLSPLAENSIDLAEQAYRAGRADFSQLIDAQQELLEIQLSYQRALVDREKRLAQLEMIVGESLLPQTENQLENVREIVK